MYEAPRNEWYRLWKEVGAEGDGSAQFAHIVLCYSEPNRFCHNMDFIQHWLDELNAARHLIHHIHRVEFALWYQYAAYTPNNPNNDQRSAEFLYQELAGSGLDHAFLDKVAGLITGSMGNDAANWMNDIEGTIFGLPEKEFELYEQRLQAELGLTAEAFGAEWVQDLTDILAVAREEKGVYMFKTPFFRAKYEEQARANIQRSLQKRMATA